MPVPSSFPGNARLLWSLDVAGTFVFALEGGLAGLVAHLDLLGVSVLAFATAFGGGIIRDVLIGATPPASLRDWRYSVVAFAGALVAMVEYSITRHGAGMAIAYFDAAGLALAAVAGTEKALAFEMHPLVAVLLGGISGVGGGTIRDVLLARVPNILHGDFYATAALIGAATVVSLRAWRVPPAVAAAGGVVLCFGLRIVALSLHWSLPIIANAR